MTSLTPEALAALQSMLPKNPRDFAAGLRAPDTRIYSAEDGVKFAERVAQALHNTERFPVDVDWTREADGSLTIHVVPQE
ncbi:hypothetical protein C1Y40_04121 [Mycobacterium talmoniae]|uniref:Uncharacterized protein n=1 Tax=Mycobacterium talmoniae TaxID=1858794 RepID=A0A2S8BG82_9MYCO|nr:hypothetical protein [Mycobacterium eburneum]PQM45677.1 hypothetical protein C1Y40_04121 [Mycobacterium talmoniae]TDH57538.1 hypothetical protein E2F47_01855 [Mycobacterium eburneum]